MSGWKARTSFSQSSDIARTPAELDALVEKVASNKERWRNEVTDVQKLAYLKQMHANLYHAAYELGDAADELRGWDRDGCFVRHAGGLCSPALSAPFVRGLISHYEDLVSGKTRKFEKRQVGNREVLVTSPSTLLDCNSHEVWSEEGKSLEPIPWTGKRKSLLFAECLTLGTMTVQWIL
jgi:hypothetical protein